MQAPERIEGWHAHVYYDDASRAEAERLRAAVEAGFTTRLGRWHDQPVGPHPTAMYQIAFEVPEFARLVPWLALNHGSLRVLIHPLTDDAVADHSRFALWLGEPLSLKLDVLRRAS